MAECRGTRAGWCEQGESGQAHFRKIDTLPDSACFLLLALNEQASLPVIFGGFGLGVQSIKFVAAEQKSFANHWLKPTGLRQRQRFTVLALF